MYKIRHLFNLSQNAFHEALQSHLNTIWGQTLISRDVCVNGVTEKRLFSVDPNEHIFVAVRNPLIMDTLRIRR